MKKNRTTPTPHRITRSVSIFEAPMEKVDDKKLGLGWMWTGRVNGVNTGYDMSVQARFNLSSKHGKLFDYALSVSNASKKKHIRFNINDFLAEADMGHTWNNKKNAIETLKQLQTITIGLNSGSRFKYFTLITGVVGDIKTGDVEILFNNDIDELFEVSKKRFVDMSKTMCIGGKAPEFAKFLQTNGRPLNNGFVNTVNEFNIIDAVQFLHLHNSSIKSAMTIIEKNLKQLEEQGYPKYKRMSHILPDIHKWVKVA